MKLKKTLEGIKFKKIQDCNSRELFEILNIRNEKDIREKMFTKNLISENEHKKWFELIKNSREEKFYLIYFKDNIVGGLGLKNYSEELSSADWAFYISKKSQFIGLGASIEFKALNYFFEFYLLKKIFCYVLKNNIEVITLHKKFGFEETLIKNDFEKKFLNIDKKNVIRLMIDSNKWNRIKNELFNKYFTKI